jgi:hypothetical protein
MSISFTQLPRELIYAIAAEDASVYNALLRTCRYISSLFPLSTRLDFMEAFGVTVKISGNIDSHAVSTHWTWRGISHDVFGPAITWGNHAITHRYRGISHNGHGPTKIFHNHNTQTGWWADEIRWYHMGKISRDKDASSCTGTELLKGVASITMTREYTTLGWYENGTLIRASPHVLSNAETACVRAEIDYWSAMEGLLTSCRCIH